ncbi:MAG TPA: universal stress protein [Trebonia sp.]|jgi:nucleotide-binding universal stress UspA family protein|nr:universal stress protein [Trebonia sp.]
MPGQEGRTESRVVVGVDGSPSSLSALRWAIRQAEFTDAAVDAVIAWHYPAPTGGYGWAPTSIPASFDFKENAEKILAEAISEGGLPGSLVPVRAVVAEGNPARVLLDVAEGADLLVVGSRGHGGFTEALLGSVGQHCVHHAHCPVVVVRDEHATAQAAGDAEVRL